MPLQNFDIEEGHSEDYELVPHKKVIELRREVDELKANPFASIPEGKEFLSTLRELTDSMNELVGLFRTAAQEMKGEEKAEEIPLAEKIEELVEQNRKIAKGIIAVADMVKELKMEGGAKKLEFMPEKPLLAPLPPGPVPPPGMPRPLPPLGMAPPPFGQDIGMGMPPPGAMPSLPGMAKMPPPPMQAQKKKGMFSFGR